jgi:zinc protease
MKAVAAPKIEFHDVQNPVAQVTKITVAFPLGYLRDDPQTQGLTGFTLNLVPMGAQGLTSLQISEKLALYGASFFFSVDRFYTLLNIYVLSEYMEPCLAFVKQVLTTATFPKEEFDLAKARAISDIKSHLESNQKLLWRAYRRWFYADAPLNQLATPTLQSIQNLTLERVRSTYAGLLSADVLKVFVVSNVDRKTVHGNVREFLSWVPSAPPVSIPSPSLIRRPKGIQVVIVNKPDTKTGDFMFVQPGVSFEAEKRHFFGALLANEAFGSGMQSRLFQELRDKRGWTYHASSGYWGSTYRNFPAPWVVYSYPSLPFTKPAVQMTFEMIQALFREGLTQQELDLYRTSFIRAYPFTIATPTKVLDKTFDEVMHGRYVLTQKEREALLQGTTLQDVVSALNAIHPVPHFVFLTVGDPKHIQSWIPEVFKNVTETTLLEPEEIL